MVPGVAILDYMVRTCLHSARPIPYSHGGLREAGEGCLTWGKYRSGGTRGTHPEMNIFSDLSPMAKPYCGVKCSRGLHFSATNLYSW